MTQYSFPWNDVNGDRLYDAEDFMRFFAAFLKTGVVMSFKDGLKIQSAQNGMNIQVGAGSAVIDGGSYLNDEAIAIQVNVASSIQDRVDSVVLRMDKNARATQLFYKAGDTTVARNDTVYELQLATISVKTNAIQITDADITDMRSDPTVCGWSTPFDNINVDGIVEQYKEIFEQKDLEFQAWFQNLKNQLDDNQAANLQNQIDNLGSEKANDTEVVHKTGDENISGNKNFTDDTKMNNLELTGRLTRPNKNVLLSGAYWMQAGQVVTPSKALSDCENGWLLHFTEYTSGMNQNTKNGQNHYCFIPKESANLGGVGISFPLAHSDGISTLKYLYVQGTKITGTGANETANSKKFVLQHILEY